MIYQYECKFDGVFEMVKPVSRSSFNEACPKCMSEAQKIIPRFHPSFGTFKPGFYHAFGKHIHTSYQLKDEIKRVAATTGKELIEVGNEGRFPSIEQKPFDMDTANRELKRAWRR